MNPKIAVIDDDKDFLAELKELLVSKNFEAYVFSDGKTALERIPQIKPDVILLDLKMDKMSGFQLADRLKKENGTREIPVIAMSGRFAEEEYKFIMNICGIKTCLKKPIGAGELFRIINAALRRAKKNNGTAPK